MGLRPLQYDKNVIEQKIKYAHDHPIPVDVLRAAVAAGHFDPDFIKPYEYHLTVKLIVSDEDGPQELETGCLTYTVEEQRPGNWVKHLSVMPLIQVAAVMLLCQEYGMDFNHPEATIEPSEVEVNIYNPFPDYKKPREANEAKHHDPQGPR